MGNIFRVIRGTGYVTQNDRAPTVVLPLKDEHTYEDEVQQVERLDPLLTVISGAVALFLLLLLAPWRRFQRGCSDSAVGPKEMFSMRDEAVEVYRMPHDGNSLFAALAHQQYQDAVGLEEHRRHTAALREMACTDIPRHMEQYREHLLESIYLHGARYNHLASDTDQMQHYLEDLARPGFPGGREVIQYIADFAKADIIIFPEGGDKEFVVSAEPGVTNVLGISRRLLLDSMGELHEHYDSVSDVNIFYPWWLTRFLSWWRKIRAYFYAM